MNSLISYLSRGEMITRPWVSENEPAAPKKIVIADDHLRADDFYRQASEGAAFIWSGDFQNAKQLLQAVQRRISKNKINVDKLSPLDRFHRHRQLQSHRAQLLSRLLIEVNGELAITLPRAPNIQDAITEAIAEKLNEPFVISLRELLGMIGAHEWRKRGVFIQALNASIHPYYGLFSPSRGEYLDLVAKAPLSPTVETAFDVGTGTGVIAALLAKRGVKKIIATDNNPRAITCAEQNFLALKIASQIQTVEANLFTEARADLIVCNPPWLPVRPTSRLERAIYDENSQMLAAFLQAATDHLTKEGEVWLIMSDLAERLGLRKPNELAALIDDGRLKVVEQITTLPTHSKATDGDDILAEFRRQEVTSLWRLKNK